MAAAQAGGHLAVGVAVGARAARVPFRLLVLAVKLHEQAEWTLVGSEHISRNFYGVLRVTEYGADDPDRHRMVLRHGRISHGCQLVDEDRCTEPTTYYWEESGIGLTLQNHPRRDQGLHVGAIGLGVGTIAAYGQPLDRYRFYEINPQVRHLATHTFTYLTNTEAKWSVVMGDARLSLERELQRGEAQQFDVLIVDAFSGDAIPVHLLTREAFDIYRQHMREGGVIAVHISNRYLDLEPVVWAMADHIGFDSVVIDTTGDDDRDVDSCTWVLVTNNQALLQTTAIDEAKREVKPEERKTLLWTDAYSDMFRILK
ncbi:fused MFS/spermidine synthase [bacterium]|nr:fused MFS/spermidine synthase [bacterium]